ncbi:ribosomal protein S2 [Westerdykella ornata]|uniref:Ribosomal protein S2 n=1 Tax=Westerdykella ornata TaxID=318751 RepID=A0A6A6J8B8_WESOR|nr:ribosomal protein S2 [Westerdykella ornata]KAF2272444.1 ribosomal protein S2 [Westerdykella ornata]
MILRHLAARNGPRALARYASQPQPLRRFYASDVDGIAASADNTLKQLHSLEAQINQATGDRVPSLNPETAGEAEAVSASPLSIVEQYHLHQKQKQVSGHLGSDIAPHYQPHTLLTHPPSPADVTLELLLASEAHQGHATSLWNPANARYIYGIRQGTHIISLEATAAHLRRAAKVVQEVARRGGMILFVGTRDGQDTAVVRAAQLAKGYHLFERWIPGSITNGQQILGRCRTKVVNEKDEEVPGFEEQLWDRPVLRPDLVVCMNPLENYVLLHECALNNIPTIGVIDTNADPTWVTYPIPANDDSLRCIQVIAGVLGRAGEAGQKQRLEAAERGEITYRPAQGLHLPEVEEAASSSAHEVVLGEESIEDADEVAGKLEDRDNHDGRKQGHRIRISA